MAFMVASASQIKAQCTTFSGTATPINLVLCSGSSFTSPIVSGEVLDANDILRYVIHTGTATQIGFVVFTGTSTGNFNPQFPISSGVYSIAAIAGDNLSSQVNTNDPCFSMTFLGTLTIQSSPYIILNKDSDITCIHPTVQLSAYVYLGGTNYVTNWTTNVVSSNGLTATANTPGLYGITVTAETGCSNTSSIQVGTAASTIQISQNDPSGCAASPSTQTLNLFDASHLSIETYSWSTGETISEIVVPNNSDAYCVTVTGGSGCTASACKTIIPSGGFNPTIGFDSSSIYCDSLEFSFISATYYIGATYEWSDGSTSSYVYQTGPGLYEVTVSLPAQGCVEELSYYFDGVTCSRLEGQVWGDLNNNCIMDAGDIPLNNVHLKITNTANGSSEIVLSYNNGSWHRALLPGTYIVEALPPSSLWTVCTSPQTIVLPLSDTISQDFVLQSTDICSRLEVEISTPILRRCFESHYFVQYQNTGSAVATGAYIDLALDDDLVFISASIPSINIGNNTYRFQLGNVPAMDLGQFHVQVMVSCDAVLGETHCTEATAFPNSPCGEQLQNWTGASLAVEAQCYADSIRFEIKNVGNAPISEALEYVIIEDAVMLMVAPPPIITLGAGAIHTFSVPANGSTWRVETSQEANHPGLSYPSVSVEGCTTNSTFSLGFVNQFPQDDADYWKDIDCTENQGSYDPNDKLGMPTGYGDSKQIGRNTDIEYMIRFQNTGTDTAFTVVIRDELSPWLDPATIVPGPSSHPYRFEFFSDGTKMKFMFDHINLPDSNVNVAASQGFVSYRVSQQKDVPWGTDIYNTADIYFDFNAPITTNTTRHRVDTSYVLVLSSWEPVWKGATLEATPNPMTDFTNLKVQGLPVGTEIRFELMDQTGRMMASQTTTDSVWRLQRGNLPTGVYFVRIATGNQFIGTAKLEVIR